MCIIKIKKKSTPAFRIIKKSYGDNDYEEKITVKKEIISHVGFHAVKLYLSSCHYHR